MMEGKPARLHESDILTNFFKSENLLLDKQVERKMLIASRLDDALKSKKLLKKDFAKMLGKSGSEISKWLSGCQNFTIDTITEIEYYLGIDLLKEAEINYCNPCEINTLIF